VAILKKEGHPHSSIVGEVVEGPPGKIKLLWSYPK
jgi:hypothetical protein